MTGKETRRRPGGRSSRVHAAVLQAARDELAEQGYAAMSAAGVADRAGVHRSTVHRRWPDLDALLVEALLDGAATAIPLPDTGALRTDLLELLGSIAAYVAEPGNRRVVRALVADAGRSPALAAIVAQAWGGRFRVGQQVIRRAARRGELRPRLPAATVLAMFTGPLYQRLLLTDDPVDAAYLREVVDLGLGGVGRGPA